MEPQKKSYSKLVTILYVYICLIIANYLAESEFAEIHITSLHLNNTKHNAKNSDVLILLTLKTSKPQQII